MNDFRRLIVDSRYKHKSSVSNSDFTIDLPQPVSVARGSKIWIDTVTFSNVFGTVLFGINDKIYVRERIYVSASAAYEVYHRIVTLSPGVYTIDEIAVELQLRLNTAPSPGISSWSVTVSDGHLQISNQTAGYSGDVKIYSRKEMLDIDTAYLDYYATNLPSANITNFREAFAFVPPLGGATTTLPLEYQDATELLGLIATPSLSVLFANRVAETQFVDLSRFKNMFIASNDLGESGTLHSDGSCDIIRRVPITSQHGTVVADSLSTTLEYNMVRSDTLLTTLRFKIKGFGDEPIPLGNHQIVFTVVIEAPE